jgi:hypothetical protein
VTPLRTLALALGVALPVGVVLSQVLPQWREDPAKVRRECIALVDGLKHDNSTIWRYEPFPHELHQELIERGVTLPSRPSLTFGAPSSGREAEAQLREYESAKTAYEAKWEEVKGSAEYQRAREAVLNRNRNRNKEILDNILRHCLEHRWPRLR